MDQKNITQKTTTCFVCKVSKVPTELRFYSLYILSKKTCDVHKPGKIIKIGNVKNLFLWINFCERDFIVQYVS